jgi:hypothetical protein
MKQCALCHKEGPPLHADSNERWVEIAEMVCSNDNASPIRNIFSAFDLIT